MKQIFKQLAIPTIIIAAYNMYFIFLMKDSNIKYLIYLDFLIAFFLIITFGCNIFSYIKRKSEIEKYLTYNDIIYKELGEFDNKAIAEHDVDILEQELQKSFNENCELQDYVTKWCHELKLPLATSLIITEKIKDAELRTSMREQLERMKQQINMLLQGCRLQSPLLDFNIEPVPLLDCIKASIKNNQFFLIQKNFSVDIKVENILIYTDMTWLVYILDQIINNAIKYSNKPEPQISLRSEQSEQSGQNGQSGQRGQSADKTYLYIEDNGEGILDSDIRHIFEKGFTGRNYHNGKYKSTGMGLYMTAKIAKALGIELSVESESQVYTRFCIELAPVILTSDDIFHMT